MAKAVAAKQEEKIEYVEFVISMPKKVLEFLEANKESLKYHDVQAYIEFSVLQTIQGDINDSAFSEPAKTIIDRILNEK